MVGGAVNQFSSLFSNSDCPQGSSCNTSAQICYYNNYGPTNGSYLLTASGGSAITEVIETWLRTRDNVLWKGLISASTQCSGLSCQK